MKINRLSLPTHYPFKTIYIAVADGTQLPVSVIGNGQPIMMLHAYGMDAREFLPFILPLTGQYQFYLPHFRGFGAAKDIKLTQFDLVREYADDTNLVSTFVLLTR